MNDVSVLIFSCDSYSDAWGPMFKLLFKYWKCNYPVYVTAQTKQCLLPDVKTINTGGTWTERMKAAVEQIPTKYIIGMCEDMFLRRPVKQREINRCHKYMEQDESIGCFNFEKEYENITLLDCPYEGFGQKPSGRHFQKSTQPTLWRRDYLLKLLDGAMTTWEWEEHETEYDHKHFIWNGSPDELVFEYGYHGNKPFGIIKGKWCEADVKPLFKKEGIDLDLSIRGTI